MKFRYRWVISVVCLAAICGCGSAREIRVQNVSRFDFFGVSIGDQHYGDIPAGATSDYKRVKMGFRYYAIIRLTAGGYHVNGQTLNAGADRFTHRVDVVDLAAGRLAIDVIRDRERR